jgi:transposase-like protein
MACCFRLARIVVSLTGIDKWHLDEVVVSIAGEKHWPWRAVIRMASCSTSWSSGEETRALRSGS